MSRAQNYIIDFGTFPMCLQPIHLRKGCCTYRYSSTSAPNTTEWPRFFSEYNIASMYDTTLDKRNVYICEFNEVTLMDVRVLKYMFLEAIIGDTNLFTLDNITKITIGNKTATLQQFVASVVYAFGMNINDNVRSILQNISGRTDGTTLTIATRLLDTFGYRLSDAEIDNYAMTILKYIFYPYIDGYIASLLPVRDSPYNFHQEICLFEPRITISRTQLTTTTNINPWNCTQIQLSDLIQNVAYLRNNTNFLGISIDPVIRQGGKKKQKGGGEDNSKDQPQGNSPGQVQSPPTPTHKCHKPRRPSNSYKFPTVQNAAECPVSITLEEIKRRVLEQMMYDPYIKNYQ